MITIDRNLDAGLLCRRPDQCSRRNRDRDVVNRQVNKFVFFLFLHIIITVYVWVFIRKEEWREWGTPPRPRSGATPLRTLFYYRLCLALHPSGGFGGKWGTPPRP